MMKNDENVSALRASNPADAKMLSGEKQALLHVLLLRKKKQQQTYADTLKALGQTLAPLSFAQERLWFIEQFSPGAATYNEPAILRCVGLFAYASVRDVFVEVA